MDASQGIFGNRSERRIVVVGDKRQISGIHRDTPLKEYSRAYPNVSFEETSP